MKKYINMILLQLSKKYQLNLIEFETYKKGKKYKNIKLIIYNYDKNEKKYLKSINVSSETKLLEIIKEMI